MRGKLSCRPKRKALNRIGRRGFAENVGSFAAQQRTEFLKGATPNSRSGGAESGGEDGVSLLLGEF